jgi:ribosomal protein L14
MMHFSNPRVVQPAKPKPRVKKGNRDTAVVVREAARVGDDDFAYFVATGKLRSTK